jgi:hypothetical protein
MAAHSDIPENVRRLLVRHIDSVQQLEILALLYGDAARAWTPPEVCRTLRISPDACRAWLESFALAGLVARDADGGFIDAGNPDARDAIDLYERRRRSVIESIYGKGA